jgi:hypothetical protein
MPLARIDLIKGKPAQYRQAVGDAVYTAMVEILRHPKTTVFRSSRSTTRPTLFMTPISSVSAEATT